MDQNQRTEERTSVLPGGRVKGAAFREVLVWMEKNLEREVLRAAYARLSAEDRELLDPSAPAFGVSASQWYPLRIGVVLGDAMTEGQPEEERRRRLREATRFSMDRTFKGVHKMLFQVMMTPERAAKHMHKMWRLNYDSGIVQWDYVRPGHIEASLRDWPGHTRNGCFMLQQMEIGFLELMGCRDVHSERTACVADGAKACTSVLTWSP